MTKPKAKLQHLDKCPTGIRGFDELSNGGLPRGRPTLLCGGPGCGKTLFAMEFLARGAMQFKEPGVFFTFEETPGDLAKNFLSLGIDVNSMIRRGLMAVDHVHIVRSEIEETGEYDLEGLFIRLSHAIDSVGAKRVVLDTIEVLFSGLSNTAILRSELRRLFKWLRDKGMTAVVTGESGEKTLTRYGLEEYVADCVILLDFRVQEQISTRRLRIIKYRGSSHGADEYPFLIERDGISVLPISSLGLNYPVSRDRISSGIPRLDHMLGGKGFYRGSTVLVSGSAGTGKSSVASYFVEAACSRGEKSLYVTFEESPQQIIRNMKSIGLHLDPYVNKGLMKYHAIRPSYCGLEMHLVAMYQAVKEFRPKVVVVDPISNLSSMGSKTEIKSMLTRLIDYLKMQRITGMLTDLTHSEDPAEMTSEDISSLVDTWILLRDIEIAGERNRCIYILKSRGMAHSNQIREFVMSDRGVDLLDVYLGPSGVLTGSARAAMEAKERAEAAVSRDLAQRSVREQEQKRKALEAQIAALEAELAATTEEKEIMVGEEKRKQNNLTKDRSDMARLRKADPSVTLRKKRKRRT
ncbi:MAG TPA: circadian clock protein KaiC [Syntrophales bacterium]|nr:circadian clock protein KaiC [Syntrophales bacterium]HPI57800.1 circadian clock protein KaiC [Syntrophales bacterium]HPN25514.1 circadian clock protein KaiC [Syntrophales bacterium]HQM28460.1 circadian clock protein KaiC [Syntrophales bacterium]